MSKDEKQLEEIKRKLTEMLAWFHDFCVKNGLTYYIAYGTMLGLMRHSGFIPWDDDIDIVMPRRDYDGLISLLGNKVCNNYTAECFDMCGGGYYYPFAKVYDTTTTLIENTRHKIKRGIYLDIFPLDGMGSSLEESKKRCEKIQKMNNVRLLKVAGFRKGRKFYKNIAVALFRLIPVSPEKILKKLDDECRKLDFYDYEYCGNLVGDGIKEVCLKRCMVRRNCISLKILWFMELKNRRNI